MTRTFSSKLRSTLECLTNFIDVDMQEVWAKSLEVEFLRGNLDGFMCGGTEVSASHTT
jgi:hypothetical protein